MAQREGPMRIAAVADLHCGRLGCPFPVLATMAESADVLLLGGDLTQHGLPEEASALVKELSAVNVPTVAVLGNHDYQSGRVDAIKGILCDAGVHLLDGDAWELGGVGFAGVKGFGGGFGERILEAWGEESIKAFVHETVEESLKLETALSQIAAPVRVALMHYAPIRATVEGEALEIFPFLGSSRLEEPLNRYHVSAAFHGHAHRGTLSGVTTTGIPVYNVSLALMRQQMPEGKPWRVIEVPRMDGGPAAAQPAPEPARSRGL
jgi:Icc-related predicted phosphoesterase